MSARANEVRELLARFAGEWAGDERLAASQWAAAGEARGTLRFAHVAGGTAVALDYRQVRGGEESINAHAVFAVDRDGETVYLWWFDSFGFPPLEPASGRLEASGPAGDVSIRLVLTRSSPRGVNRTTFTLASGDGEGENLRQRVELKLPDATQFETLVEGEYRRA